MQDRRIATPIQQHQHLLLLAKTLAHGGQQRRGDQGFAWLVIHVHASQHRQGAVAHTAGHGQALVARRRLTVHRSSAVVPTLKRGRGRTQQHLCAFKLATVDRQIAGRVAGTLLLFVAGVVLLINHNEFQVWHGGQHRQTCAQHNTRRPQMGCQPTVEALRWCHGAVHGDDGAVT